MKNPLEDLKKLDAKVQRESNHGALEFFVAWIISNIIYFACFGLLGSIFLTKILGVIPYHWVSYCLGIAFGFIISKGFFPIGMANGMLKAHWQYVKDYREKIFRSAKNRDS